MKLKIDFITLNINNKWFYFLQAPGTNASRALREHSLKPINPRYFLIFPDFTKQEVKNFKDMKNILGIT